MTEKPHILRIGDADYDISQLSEDAHILVSRLQYVEQMLSERNNLLALLNKAKNAYIADLKAETIKNKTGVDFSTLFDEE